MKTGRYNFKELLTHNEIDQIIIPEIQRDYVWQKENVDNLINDILSKFEEKEKISNDFSVNGIGINDNISSYLQREYERLRFHLKLGFIYAYYDREYPGKFFLIDGQQRITSLYLLLLYLTTQQEKDEKDRLKKLYFKKGNLKIDYKVREESHDFMELLVRSELKGESYRDQKDYYKTIYENDVTVRHLTTNYALIKQKLEGHTRKRELLEFLEEFVEFNYFDTNLSEQGEQLYIYMNSRGEDLSFQETVRADFIKKIEDANGKKQFAQKWEEWQNFFWKNRGANENADKGFQEFLKWVVIIDLWKEGNKKDRNEYISGRIEDARFPNRIKAYLKNVSGRSVESTFDALKNLMKQKVTSEYILFEDHYLEGRIDLIDYIFILPLLVFLRDAPEAEINLKELESRAMFLKNRTFYENIGKSPSEHLFSVITLINDSKNHSFTEFIRDNKNSFTENESNIADLLFDNEDNSEEWESFFWKIIKENNFNSFLLGNTDVIIHNSQRNELIDFEKTREIIYKVFYENKDKNELRGLMLCHFDFAKWWGISNEMDKYNLLGATSTDSWNHYRRWKEVFDLSDFKNLIKWIKIEKSLNLEILFKKSNRKDIQDYRKVFIDYPELLEFCEKENFVRKDENRIVLLRRFRHTIDSAREIQCELLKISFNQNNTKRKMWCYQDRTCVLDFNYNEDEQFEYFETANNGFAIDLKFNIETKNWTYKLFHRANTDFNIEAEEKEFYSYQSNQNILDNNENLLGALEKLIPELEEKIKLKID